MKKLIIIAAAALLALAVCTAALANDTAADLFEKTASLLLNTDNVTLTVNAEFRLDGEWFKTAEGTWKQDGSRSYRQLLLKSPKLDGSERRNGYTIVTDGDNLYLMEVYTPGVYRSGFTAGRKSILRNTVETDMLRVLAKAAASQSDLVLGEGSVTRTTDGGFLVKLGDNVPEMANAALSQFVRFAAKRYFGMDYDRMRIDSGLSMYHFATLTEGLLYATQGVSIREAEISVKTDENGNLQHWEGRIGLYVRTAADGPHQLDISFRADISDAGRTVVKKFNPDEYMVTEAYEVTDVYGAAVMPEGESVPEDVPAGNEALIDKMELEAMRLWSETGFNMVATTSVSCMMEGGDYVVSLEGGDNIAKKTWFRADGEFTSLHAEPTDWMNADRSVFNYNPAPDAETDRKTKEFLMEFLKTVDPELPGTIEDLKMEWMYEKDGAVYAQYHEEPLNVEYNGTLFVVRLSPSLRIEYFSCVSNG